MSIHRDRSTPIDTRFFQEHGYQVLRGLLAPEVVGAVRAFLEEELTESVTILRRTLGVDADADIVIAATEAVDGGRFGDLAFETQQLLSGHFALRTRLSERLWPISKEPGIRAVLQSIFDDDRFFMHMPPAARWVLPGYGQAGVPAHQDVSYSQHMSDFVTVWTPFVPIDEACGGVAVFPGSGEARERATQKSERFWLASVGVEGLSRVHEPMEPGDVLLLSKWIVHESMPNRSDRIRFSVDYRFFSSRARSTKHHLDLQTMKVLPPVVGGSC